MNLEWIEQPDGYKVMSGPHLVARLTTKTQAQITGVNGFVVVWKDMDRADWTLHFAAANMPLAVVESVVKSLPAQA